MRVAFPVGTAYLRWAKEHENRRLAFEELHVVCPEIEIHHEEEFGSNK
jgi:hypothetical protein